VASLRGAALLERLATFDDVGRVAAFVASDHARTMTSSRRSISRAGHWLTSDRVRFRSAR
jgi:enoyl-[acyl-carrier-protein] reductase (NADH)